MAKYNMRPYREGDAVGILETFNTVFGENFPGFKPRSMQQWRWAFEQNPAGKRIWVAECEGQIAAQCAALPYRVWIDGQRSSFTQGVDSMVHPDHRRGLRRPGLFVATAKPFFEEFTGPGKDILHYGWPVEPAWRIGRTFLGYQIVNTQSVHFLGTDACTGEVPEGVERLTSFDADAEALYDRCRNEGPFPWGASVIRDAAYLNWRYITNPHFDYDIFGVRRSGKLVGFTVYRRADSPRPNSGLIMDWLVPTDEPEAAELLREALKAQARQDGTDALLGVFPGWSHWHLKFQQWGWSLAPSDYLLIGIIQNPRYDTHWLRDNWWYQLSDLDAV